MFLYGAQRPVTQKPHIGKMFNKRLKKFGCLGWLCEKLILTQGVTDLWDALIKQKYHKQRSARRVFKSAALGREGFAASRRFVEINRKFILK